MAKGYMVFVEGGDCPQVVHTTFDTALYHMRNLAEKNPGKEVMLFELHKRRVSDGTTNTPLPCHIPADFKHPERLKRDRLVYKNALKPVKKA